MKPTSTYLLLFVLAFFNFQQKIVGQNNASIIVEGNILEEATGQPVPFAHIINLTTKKVSISNASGYFRLALNSYKDSVQVSFVGLKTKIIGFEQSKTSHLIYLKAENLQLNEVNIIAKDNSYLFNLLVKCRRKASLVTENAKTYYELKSFVDGNQVELVEGFYNMSVAGYELKNLSLKAGRLGLTPFGQRFFTSLESSKAIALQQLFSRNSYFPTQLLELSKRQMKKRFYLQLEQKYVDEHADSIYVLSYTPKENNGQYFGGKIWVNVSKLAFLKITFIAEQAQQHPFLPLFENDEILHVDLNITKNFKNVNGHYVFNQIDFTYKVNYANADSRGGKKDYEVETKAILYAYDFDNEFFTPKFNFPEGLHDYAKITALPESPSFWAHYNGYRVKNEQNSNEQFLSNKKTLTKKNLNKPNRYLHVGFLEHPFLPWDNKRLVFKQKLDTALHEPSIMSYKLSVDIFMDVNIYDDTSEIVTATILNPYKTFYNDPITPQALCFINMYFDLCEIERRKFAAKLPAYRKNISALNKLYAEMEKNLNIRTQEFINAVKHGENRKQMEYYNEIIKSKLEIDNIAIYNPFAK